MPAKKKEAVAETPPSPRAKGRPVRFEAEVQSARGGRAILRLPAAASEELPSRGQVAVNATLGSHAFSTVVEPDGEFGHWLSLDAALLAAARVGPGDAAQVELVPASEWPEPVVPKDLKQALSAAPGDVRELWKTITPMARWEWVRWINETKNPATRTKRVEVGISKLHSGKRRPCCFNLASCTDPELAKSGKLAV